MDETESFQPVAVEADPDLTINAFRIDDNDERFDDEIFRDTTANNHIYFLGECCDFRKAVLWVNGIWMVAIFVFMIIVVVLLNQSDFEEDDYVVNDLPEVKTLVIVIETIAIALAAIGFYGALKFKFWAVFVAALAHGISFVFAVIQFRTSDATSSVARLVVTVVSLYAHICLLHLMRKGIIQESNYHTISSCCGPNPNPNTDPKDQHMYFFGCCCDFRRAVVVLNAISIVIRFLLVVAIAIIGKYVTENWEDLEDNIQDDDLRNEIDMAVKSGYATVLQIVLEVVELCAVAFGAIGLYGALKFKLWAIITAASFYSVALFAAVLMLNYIETMIYSIYVYAHFAMIRQMRAGIMTDESYHNVARCCRGKNSAEM